MSLELAARQWQGPMDRGAQQKAPLAVGGPVPGAGGWEAPNSRRRWIVAPSKWRRWQLASSSWRRRVRSRPTAGAAG
eukprot:355541-Chlamydomonas_euryale.AAC.2